MPMTPYNTEQAARGYLMYALAIRGYKSLLADSRFPREDMLVVSPSGKHFGIEVKGQRIAKNFWRFSYRSPHPEIWYAFIFVPENGTPKVFIMESATTMEGWKKYKEDGLKRGLEDNQWGLPWTTPLKYENRWNLLPE